jgi:rubredoxin
MSKKKRYIDICRERNEPIFDYECPKCGWNAIREQGLRTGYCEIVESQKTVTDFGPGVGFLIKCVCPVCGSQFEYSDGAP